MDNGRFWQSIGGRIAQGTGGILGVLAGILAFLGPGPLVDGFIPFAMVLGYIGFIAACGFSVQDFWAPTLAMILTMPLVFTLYFAALYVVAQAGSMVGVFLIVAGLLAVGLSLTGVFGQRAAQHAPATSH